MQETCWHRPGLAIASTIVREQGSCWTAAIEASTGQCRNPSLARSRKEKSISTVRLSDGHAVLQRPAPRAPPCTDSDAGHDSGLSHVMGDALLTLISPLKPWSMTNVGMCLAILK
ncbi:hypothetical protein MRB53_037584 [Persea americana]|nr:hypothetical protein MRB53_037584 [Persea americana]